MFIRFMCLIRYIILELCAGTLDQICGKGKVYSGPVLPSDQTVLYQIADGLHYIHSHKLVHRDVKPENVLISMTGQIKLSEFGLCHRQIASPATMDTFSAGGFKAPVMWMAPELLQQLDIKPDSPVKSTPQSDIFSAGCVFFVFVTRGHANHPFGDDHNQVQNNIRNNQPINIDSKLFYRKICINCCANKTCSSLFKRIRFKSLCGSCY